MSTETRARPTPNAATRPRRAWHVILAVIVAVGAAVGLGYLVGNLIQVGASPVDAVADTIGQLTQGSTKEAVVDLLGGYAVYDKVLLKLVIGIVLLLLAVLAGRLSVRTPVPARVLIVLFGVAAVIATALSQKLGQLALLAPLVTLVAAVMVFEWLYKRIPVRSADGPAAGGAPTEAAPADGAPASTAETSGEQGPPEKTAATATTTDRRTFLGTSAGVAVAGAVAGGAGSGIGSLNSIEGDRSKLGGLVPARSAPAIPAGAAFTSDGTPPFITPTPKFYRVDTAFTVPQVQLKDWKLRVHGMVDREMTYTFDDIRDRDLEERTITLTCVSNPVGGPYISTTNFVGVPLRELLDEAGVKPGADQVFSTSVDNYTAGTPVRAVMDPDRGAMLAIGMNRKPLPAEHGFPARMVVPGLYGYVSATKWVTDIELTTFAAKKAYWVPRGYSAKAPIKTESRIDSPKPFDNLKTGRVTVSGIAWAQPKGIDRVEVRMNSGPWKRAQLATEVNTSTWRMWKCEFDVKSGSNTVEARAVDKTGYTQTQNTASALPDGATGWPSIVFNTG